MMVAAISTRAWPERSISRPQAGAATAVVKVATAVTIPARPYDPEVMEISSTMPRPVIAIGSRAANPAAVNARASGVLSTRRYAPNPAAMPALLSLQ